MDVAYCSFFSRAKFTRRYPMRAMTGGGQTTEGCIRIVCEKFNLAGKNNTIFKPSGQHYQKWLAVSPLCACNNPFQPIVLLYSQSYNIPYIIVYPTHVQSITIWQKVQAYFIMMVYCCGCGVNSVPLVSGSIQSSADTQIGRSPLSKILHVDKKQPIFYPMFYQWFILDSS